MAASRVEDDCWAERGKFDHEQDVWKMNVGWGGVRMTAG